MLQYNVAASPDIFAVFFQVNQVKMAAETKRLGMPCRISPPLLDMVHTAIE